MRQRASLSPAWLVAEATQRQYGNPFKPPLVADSPAEVVGPVRSSCDRGPTLSPRRLGRHLLNGAQPAGRRVGATPLGSSLGAGGCQPPSCVGAGVDRMEKAAPWSQYSRGTKAPVPKLDVPKTQGQDGAGLVLCAHFPRQSGANTPEGTLAW